MTNSKAEIGSRTAKGGFAIETEVERLFNDWENQPLAQSWLLSMGYDVSKIKSILAIQIPVRIKKQDLPKYRLSNIEDFTQLQKYKKADIQVQLKIQLHNSLKLENISVKKANKGANFNQIDKRPVEG